MSVTVTGVLDDVAYRVTLTGQANTPVAGSKRVSALVKGAAGAGTRVLLGPTGPEVPVTAADHRSVLALLARTGTVTTVTGLPLEQMRPKAEPGVIL